MSFLLDTDVFIDLSRGNQSAADYVDALTGDWSFSIITALEFLAGAKNQSEVHEIDLFVSTFDVLLLSEATGLKAYHLMKDFSLSHGLRTFDSLIAAVALEHDLTLVTRNGKHFRFIPNLKLEVPTY